MEVGDDLEPADSLLFTLKMFVFMLSKKFCGYAHTHARTHAQHSSLARVRRPAILSPFK